MLLASVLSPMILLSLRLLGILKGDDPTPLGLLLSCIFMTVAVVKYGLFDPVKNAKNHIIEQNHLMKELVNLAEGESGEDSVCIQYVPRDPYTDEFDRWHYGDLTSDAA